MKQHRTIVLAILAASLIVSCTCSLLPLGPRLPESRRLGDMTIHYPEEWHAERLQELVPNLFLVISPEEIIDVFEMQPQPVLIVVYGDQEWSLGQVHEDERGLLDELTDDLSVESIGSEETIEGRGASWMRTATEGTFDLFESSVVGWLAVVIRGDEFAFVLAAAPESEWEEYEDIFDAMLERIEFN